MSVEKSLAYQIKFFDDFADAWQNHSYYRLYNGINETATTLRLDIHEVPGYILAYNKDAQAELHDFLQSSFVAWLREYVPFFEVSDDGHVYFGDWYHRREFGQLDVFAREILHQNEDEQDILPHLQAFAKNPDHYLDEQVEFMRKSVYQTATDLHNQIETIEADTAEAAPQSGASTNGGFRGLLKNFIDPEGEDDSTPVAPTRRNRRNVDIGRLRDQFADAKEKADLEFDSQKRAMQVSAAVTRYEYQAVMTTYSSIDQFINILNNLSNDYMKALKKEEAANRA